MKESRGKKEKDEEGSNQRDSNPRLLDHEAWAQPLRFKHFYGAHLCFKVLVLAAVAVAQLVKRPELRSLKEVQLNWREFDSWLRHRSWGNKSICGSVRQNTCTQE